MDTPAILLCLTACLIVAGLFEARAHSRLMERIPTRIHVNGTRGKSSVTRLIAAGLRAAGVRTVAKTTGTLASIILPDGSERRVPRFNRANVIEQRGIVAAAATLKAEALVIECMALQPKYQWFCESRLIRATHGVITNARADHLDVMGPTEGDVAKALCGMVPVRGVLFTAESRHRSVIEDACADRETSLVAIKPDQIADVGDADMSHFPYIEHKENVALALAVLKELGIDRDVALEGMWSASPDPGAMTVHRLVRSNGQVTFINGFAANDPESTEMIWQMALDHYGLGRQTIAVFNCRDDRVDRSIQLAEACVHWKQADRYLLIGTGTSLFVSHAVHAGLDPNRVITAEGEDAASVFELLEGLCSRPSMVMGLGNIGGPGLELVELFRHESMESRQPPLEAVA